MVDDKKRKKEKEWPASPLKDDSLVDWWSKYVKFMEPVFPKQNKYLVDKSSHEQMARKETPMKWKHISKVKV